MIRKTDFIKEVLNKNGFHYEVANFQEVLSFQKQPVAYSGSLSLVNGDKPIQQVPYKRCFEFMAICPVLSAIEIKAFKH